MPRSPGFHRPNPHTIRPNDPLYCAKTLFHRHQAMTRSDGTRHCRACKQPLDKHGRALLVVW
jgi:hypothetical protein